MNRQFTGRHMALTMVGGFGVVVAVNLLMASYAISTFGGVVVENSYVASQEFNGWLAQAEHSRRLGWDVALERADNGLLVLRSAKVPAHARVSAIARHPLGGMPDTQLRFAKSGEGRWISSAPLAAGRWTVRLEIVSGEDRFRAEQALP